jgi:hypothetical protein
LTDKRVAQKTSNHDLPASPGRAGTFDLQANLLLLESQAHLLLLNSLEEFYHLRIRRTLNRSIDLDATLQNQVRRWREWEDRINAVVEASLAMNHPIILAAALSIRAAMKAVYLLNQRTNGLNTDLAAVVSEGLLKAATADAKQAIEIYSQADQLEGQLRAKMHLADLWTLAGDTSSAQRLAEQVLPIAQAMDYFAVEVRAREHASGQSPVSRSLSLAERNVNTLPCGTSRTSVGIGVVTLG